MSSLDGNIIWLASYPKSGNTWTRLFLTALMQGKPLTSLDNIKATDGIGSGRSVIDYYLGMDSTEINQLKLQGYRSQINKLWSDEMEGPTLVKTHDSPFHRGIRIITKAETKKVILIVRNPFDLTASYANHMSCSIEQAIMSLCDTGCRIAKTKRKYPAQVSQHIGSWSSYYNDWKNAFGEGLMVLKFEDLKKDPVLNFSKVVQFLEWDYTEEQISDAVVNSDFKKLKKLEEDGGFKEAAKNSKSFFRAGKTGNWKNEISKDQAEMLIDSHYSTLLELGYIDSDRNILV